MKNNTVTVSPEIMRLARIQSTPEQDIEEMRRFQAARIESRNRLKIQPAKSTEEYFAQERKMYREFCKRATV